MGAGDDQHRLVDAPALLGGLPGLERIGDADHERHGLFEIGAFEHFGARGIAGDDFDALRTRRIGGVLAILDDEEGTIGRPQRFAHYGADAAIADQHHVARLAGGQAGWHIVRLGIGLRHGPGRLGGGNQIGLAPDFGRFGARSAAEARFERGPELFEPPEDDRVQHDGDERARKDQVAAFGRQDAEADAERRENERELADLREAGRNGQRRRDRPPEGDDDAEGKERLPHDDDQHRGDDRERIFDKDHRVEQHADGHEEQHGKGVAERQGLLRGAVAQLTLGENHAGEEGAERQRYAEEIGGARRHPERDGEHGEAEQFAAAGMGGVVKERGDEPPPYHQHEAHKGRELDHGDGENADKAELAPDDALDKIDEGIVRIRAFDAENAGHGGDQHQREHHGEIFDDEPADRDAALLAFDHVALLQRLEQHHRGGDREREAEDQARADRPAERRRKGEAKQRRAADLHYRTRNGEGADREQVLEREMQTHPEHQEDDADLAQLRREVGVGHEAGSERPDRNTGDEIADQRRHAEPIRQCAEDICQNQTRNDG